MKKAGFSLVELMIVVAILSLTAAILVPRFLRYQHQQDQRETVKKQALTE